MFKLPSIVVLLSLVVYCLSITELLPTNELFAFDITPPNPIRETLLQCFKCKPGSQLRKLVHYSSYDDTTSCNDWRVGKSNAVFNMTLGNEMTQLKMKNLTTYTVHLNGNLLLIQRGAITEGECAGGYFEKFVFNAVDQNGCSGEGITKQIPLYALAQITNGTCAAVCPGKVGVWFQPPVKNVI